jgi:uncharacterized nucleotidyltransferase DUF6036
MPNFEKIPEPWLSFLRELDSTATEETRLDCMGGFVVTQRYGLNRPTADLDIFELAPRKQLAPLLHLGQQGGELHKKLGVYLDHVGVAHVPDDYEDRLSEMFSGIFRHLRICALDPYDLALSKLERNLERDRADVRHLACTIPLDSAALKARYEKELRWQMAIPEREDLTLRLWLEMIEEERRKFG